LNEQPYAEIGMKKGEDDGRSKILIIHKVPYIINNIILYKIMYTI